MELYQLEQFKTAAEISHITRAAKKLALSQPALSKNIKALENELGYPLFDHIGKNVQLNDNGKIMLECAEEIFNSIDNAKRKLKEKNHNSKITISLCINAASKMIPEILLDYHKKHQDINFSLTQNPQDNRAKYDFIISASLEPMIGENSCILVKEPLYIALPMEHPFSSQKTVKLSELKNEPFISLQKGMSLSFITEHYCKKVGFTPNIVFESDNPATLRNLIQLGLGVAFIPIITWNGLQDNNICLLPLAPEECYRYIILSWCEKRYLTAAAKEFREFMIQYFKNLAKEF